MSKFYLYLVCAIFGCLGGALINDPKMVLGVICFMVCSNVFTIYVGTEILKRILGKINND